MVELHTRKDIEGIAYDILKSSKSWGKYPTPVDTIVNYSDLIVNKTVDVSQIHHGYASKVTDSLLRALAKVRGVFDRKEKTIYLDLTQNDQKKNFVKLHEVGHGVLPWQNETSSFLDDDHTLSLDHREQFEAEANLFASAALFQLDRFEDEMVKLQFGLKSGMALAKMFGGSNHASLRRYVERSKNRCGLLVLKDLTGFGKTAKCNLRNHFASARFIKEFGNIVWPEEFNAEWSFVQDYTFGRRMKISGELTISVEDDTVDFHYDFFDNTYNAFVLIYPVGEKTGGKTRVIITDL